MGLDWSKISQHWPQNDICLTHPNWDDTTNAAYRNALSDIRPRLMDAIPINMDIIKISMCKQLKGEPVSAYLIPLMEIHERHCGINRPALAAEGGNPRACVSHLCSSFINGLLPTIAQVVKQQCILWETSSLNRIEQYALHAQKFLSLEEERKTEKRATDLHNATLTVYQNQAGRNQGGR